MTSDEEERTVFRASTPASEPPSGAPASAPPPPHPFASAPVPPTTSFTGFAPMPPRTGDNGIQIGDVLNHIFAVKRFIARGGMGEVFEGENVNTEERVAIKVILPALAADPSIQAMFRKEARTLTRLSHPALVQYRVLAQEPQLGVFYIVTEYVDGPQLSERLATLHPSGRDLIGLIRRLAEGLRAAHALGAIHRDIAPDNVLLEEGRLDRARIIDFGIAKDLDPGSKTIVGDGFAGKLGYVAPEQLGDFDKQVGPWTDVYSLGLVILAAALGREPGLGGGFVEAIDKRRRGIDLSGVPADVRPILEQMLTANPLERLRSMDEVIAALDRPASGADKPAVAPAPEAPLAAAAKRPADPSVGKSGGNRMPLMIGGGVAGIAVLGIAGFLAFGGSSGPSSSAGTAMATATTAAGGDGVTQAKTFVTGRLPTLTCTWLDLVGAAQVAGGVDVKLAGVAGHAAESQTTLMHEAERQKITLASLDFSEVAPITGSECDAIDALRSIRATTSSHLSVPQRTFEMSKLPAGSTFVGQLGARVVVDLNLTPGEDFAIYGIEPNGAISGLIPDRKTFDAIAPTNPAITNLGGGHYRLQTDANHSGWSGLIMLSGRGGFSDQLMLGKAGQRSGDWLQRFATAARAGGWKSEMVWFKMVDEVPN